MENLVELLAPVGNMESLYAAVANGADAVYLGGKLFNARHYASNFSNSELKEAVEYCHLRDVKVYVTVNILLDNSEIEEALDYVKYLYDIDVDGIIVQDIGLASLVRDLMPDLELHGSTQMTINNLEGANFLYEAGFTRVVLARETPLSEIKYISDNSPIELEVFIHGALCVSYSGQCLMSSMIGARSGNRGRCAQPCRMPSSIVSDSGDSFEDWENKHILSPRDLNTVEEIEELIKAGVLSYKIEGRMKRPEYVATVVSTYRKAMDMGSDSLTMSELEDLEQIFNRGFTKGLTFKDFGRNFISYDRPDNRGLFLGRIAHIGRDSLRIKLERPLEPGDGIELSLAKNRYKGIRVDEAGDVGDYYEIPKIANVDIDSPVYKSSSAELLERARDSYRKERSEKDIHIKLKIRQGEYPELACSYMDEDILIRSDDLVEGSKKVALTEERVFEQLSKLGDTVYNLKSLDLDLEESSFLAMSSLNALRRKLVDELDRISLKTDRLEIDQDNFDRRKSQLLDLSSAGKFPARFSVKIEDFNQLRSLNMDKLDRIYLAFYEDKNFEEALDYLDEYRDFEIYIYTEKILYSQDLERLGKILDSYRDRIDGVSVSNLGVFNFVRKNYDFKIHGDLGLNIFNSYSLRFLAREGLDSTDLSIELTLDQISRIVKTTPIELSSISYGYIPVMVSKHCPMSLVKGCKDDSNCYNCEFRKGYRIKDRIGAEFGMIRKSGFTNIYNSVPIFVLDRLTGIKDRGPAATRIDFSLESDGIREIQEIYYDYFKGELGQEEALEFTDKFREKQEITNGHYFRGIMD